MNKRIKEAFDQVCAEEELKNKTMEFLVQQTGGFSQRFEQLSRQKGARPYGKMAAAAAGLALMLLGTGGYRLYFIPTTSIDIEINPSVSLGINRFDKVVTMESHNEDGSILLDSVNVKYADYTDAINEILAEESIASYLAQDEIMEISVTGSDDKKNQEVLSGVESCTGSHRNIQCYDGNSELAAEAREHGLSTGKYQAYLELKEQNPDVDVESVQGMTMRQLHDWIEACGENAEHENERKTGQHSGNENANGSQTGQHSGNGAGQGSGSGSQAGQHSGDGADHGSVSESQTGQHGGNGAGQVSVSESQTGQHSGNGTGQGSGSVNGDQTGHHSGSGAGQGSGNGSQTGHHSGASAGHGSGGHKGGG